MHDAISRVALAVGLPETVVLAGASVFAFLALGSVLRIVGTRRAPPVERRQRLGSLAVWWVMFAAISLIVVAGRAAGAMAFAIVSLLAVREYFQLLAKKTALLVGRWCVMLAVPAAYAGVLAANAQLWSSIMLVVVVIGITVRLVVAGTTSGFIESVCQLSWSYVVLVFFLSHAAMLLTLPAETNPVGGGAGWLLYLIAFTEADDIFQALWGRRLGKRKITPVVSPGKTWEGFVLGGLSALALGVLLAPWLTPLAQPWVISLGNVSVDVPYLGVLVAGLLLSVAGFFGDLNISAVKRDVRVKDSGDWLPGQGGILDRIDSLTFTAPVFYYFVRLMYG